MDNPKVKGLLKESGGKMYMSERQWKDAQECFQTAFENYSGNGDSGKAILMLKYVILAEILEEAWTRDKDYMASNESAQNYAKD